MRIIYDVDEDKYERIKGLIAHGNYSTVQGFIAVAIDNQLYVESQEPVRNEVATPSPTRAEPDEASESPSAFLGMRELDRSWVESKTTPAVPASQLKDQTMPFSNRIFPTKLAIRVLCNTLAGSDSVDVEEFCRIVAEAAARVGLYLMSLDKSQSRSMRLEALSIGLPVGRRGSIDLAKRKFLTHVIGGLTPARQAYGSLLTLGLAGLPTRGRLGVTEDGLQFARIPNPILDGNRSTEVRFLSTLSEQEALFYINLVKRRLPAEAQTMKIINQIVSGGADRYQEILAQYCREMRISPKEGAVRQRVSAELARLKELGIINSRSEGLKTFYTIGSATRQEAS